MKKRLDILVSEQFPFSGKSQGAHYGGIGPGQRGKKPIKRVPVIQRMR